MSKRSFAKALRQARLKAGLSQSELGAKVGLTGSYISQLEAGHRRPLIGRRIEALCQALEIPSGPLQEAAEMERSSPTVRKKIEGVHRDRAKLQRTRDRLLLLSALVADRQAGGAEALERLPDLKEEQRRLAVRLFSQLRGVDGVASAERESERVFDGIKSGQRDTLLRLVSQILEQAIGAPAVDIAPPDTKQVPERATLAAKARVVARHPMPEHACGDDAFFWRVPDDEGHPRIEADDRLLLEPVPEVPDGELVVVQHSGRGHVRRLFRQGDRYRLESLRPDVPPLRLPIDGTDVFVVRQIVRDV